MPNLTVSSPQSCNAAQNSCTMFCGQSPRVRESLCFGATLCLRPFMRSPLRCAGSLIGSLGSSNFIKQTASACMADKRHMHSCMWASQNIVREFFRQVACVDARARRGLTQSLHPLEMCAGGKHDDAFRRSPGQPRARVHVIASCISARFVDAPCF